MGPGSFVAGGDRDVTEWHEWRRLGIGASDAGAVCGLSPWRSALAVWLDKTGRTSSSSQPGGREPDWLYWGKRMEGVLREEFTQLYGLEVDFAGSWHERPGRAWQRATLDGLVFEGQGEPLESEPGAAIAILELKTTSWRSPLSWDDGVPKLYQIQVQHQLMVTGLEMGYLAVLHDGSRFRVHELERDEEAIATLEEIEAEFWACVTHDRPPPADASRSTEMAVRSAYSESDPGTTVVLDQDALARVRAYTRLQSQRQALDEQLTEAKLALMVALGEAEVGTDQDGEPLLTWKGYQTQSVDLDALRKAHPEIVREHTRQTPARRFQVKAAAVAEEETT